MGCELDVIVCLIEDLKELPTDRTTELWHGNVIHHWVGEVPDLYHKSGSEDECEKELAWKSSSRLELRLEIQFPWSWQRIVVREDSQWMHVLKGGYVGWVSTGLEFFNFSRVLKARITLLVSIIVILFLVSVIVIWVFNLHFPLDPTQIT